GQRVPPERVTSLTFKSSRGSTFKYTGNKPEWQQANFVLKRLGRFESTDVRYVLQNVTVDGSNVVSAGQQRFGVQQDAVWNIRTLLYYARFKATDAVFDSKLGTGITLQYPDQHVEKLAFDATGALKAGPLARGIYYVKVVGASGMASLTPVA